MMAFWPGTMSPMFAAIGMEEDQMARPEVREAAVVEAVAVVTEVGVGNRGAVVSCRLDK